VKPYFKEFTETMVVITQAMTTIYCSISIVIIAFDKKGVN